MSKETFKTKVKKAVNDYAFEKLKEECKKKSKTQNIRYEKFAAQEYIKKMNPVCARIIFKCRSKTLNIREHTKYQNIHQTCRWCGMTDETLEHVTNCGNDEEIMNVEAVLNQLTDLSVIEKVAGRVRDFLSKVEV